MRISKWTRRLLCAAAGAAISSWPGLAFSWGAEGHEYVGSIADQLIAGTTAASNVRAILGDQIADLKTAAPWADCVRSVAKSGDPNLAAPTDTYTYTPDPAHPEYTAHCHAFEGASEKQRMEDYARRNWSNCVYAPGLPCHEGFHFADVPVQHGDYRDKVYAGTNDHDVVHAIQACIDVLQGRAPKAPFSIRDKKEALLLLAHFVGDEAQPLHVGAVYLDKNGRRVNPTPQTLDPKTETRGGNSIMDGGRKLHSEWDDPDPATWTTPASAADVATAKSLKSKGDMADWPVEWASGTVTAAQSAFSGVSFGPQSHGKWPARFKDPAGYVSDRSALQKAQLQAGGAHLAEIVTALLS